MGQRSVRFPDELQARAEAWAGENERPFSYVVVKALESFLGLQDRLAAGGSDDARPAVQRKVEALMRSPEMDAVLSSQRFVEGELERAEAKAVKPAVLKRGSQIVMRFRCPDAACRRVFGSGAAVCPDHGRKAVPA